MKHKPFSLGAVLLLTSILLLLSACTPEATPSSAPAEPAAEEPATDTAEVASTSAQAAETIDPSKYDEFEIVTLLPRDAIPAIDDPQFLTAAEASEEYEPDELILGVFINGEARAYSVPHLSSHEIVNDTVGGRKISVTW